MCADRPGVGTDIAEYLSCKQYRIEGGVTMATDNYRVSVNTKDQPFRFFITGGSVSRATVTLLAKDLDVARNMATALFPGAEISEHEVPYANRH